MSNENESILQVPISEEAKAALQERATANGRAMGREAQQILNKTLLKSPKANAIEEHNARRDAQ